jgi:nitrate/TMAO reductase-like tetraheme cytochrome c subunit
MKKSTILIITASAMVAILMLLVAGPITRQPFFCRSCHLERDIYKAWKASPHKEVSCLDCHQTPGVIGFLVYQVKMTKRISSSLLSSYKKPLISNIDNSSCLRCHQTISKKTAVGNAIRVRHKDFLDEGQKCTDCHGGVGHEKTLRKQNVPSMDKCTRCHDQKTASAKCNLCHLEKVKRNTRHSGSWGITHGKDWAKTHGMGNLTICIICHPKKDCSKCHLAMPHDPNWAYRHSKQALKRDCLSCHVRSFCDECHGIEMPHPSSFLPNHRKVSNKRGKDFCYRCHVKDDCQQCHVRHIHPGLNEPVPAPGGE